MADSNQTTVIGSDTTIKGEIKVNKIALILGKIEGTISGKGEIQLSSGATCNASVDANKVMIEGAVEGDVTGRESVKLAATARVNGDLIAARLIVEEGAVFMGHCQVGGDVSKAADAKRNGAASMTEAKPNSKEKAEAVLSRG